jgi:hypothetical protein
MNARYKERTGHLIAHWGVPRQIYPRKSLAGQALAVVEFAPRPNEEGWRYITNGMSEYLQLVNDTRVRTELLAYSLKRHDWIVDLLDGLSRYPTQHGTFFAEFDTIPVGQPIDRGASCFHGVLLAPLPRSESASLDPMWGLFPEPVHTLLIVGIHASEIAFASEHGGKALFDSVGSIVTCLDAPRGPVV